MKKSNPYNDKYYKTMQGVCLWLWNWTCYFCERNNLPLDTHHIDRDNSNNEITNLVPVCTQCHSMMHRVSMTFSVSRLKIVSLLLQKVNQFLPRKSHDPKRV